MSTVSSAGQVNLLPVDYLSTIEPLRTIERVATLVGATELTPLPPGLPIEKRVAKSFKAFEAQVLRDAATDKPVSYEMPPGTGKSTMAPMVFHEVFGSLVIVVEPTASLARTLAEFKGVPYVSEYSHCVSGVVYTDGKNFLSSLIEGALPERFVLVHDECHATDYVSYVIRRVAPRVKGVEKYIQLTATPDGSVGTTGRKSGAFVLDCRDVVVPRPIDWELSNDRSPFSVARLSQFRSVAIFSDDDNMSNSLLVALSKKGFDTWMLRRGDSYKKVKECLATLVDPKNQVVGFFDSSYSSGYNVECDLLIDCGVTRYTSYSEGVILDSVRASSLVELRQRRERIGRTKPGFVLQEKPRIAPSHAPLNFNEVDHAVAALALLGYRDVTLDAAGAVLPVTVVSRDDLLKFCAQAFPYMYWLNLTKPSSRPSSPQREIDLDSAFFLRKIHRNVDEFFSGDSRTSEVDRLALESKFLPREVPSEASDQSGSEKPESQPASALDVFCAKIHEEFGSVGGSVYLDDDFLAAPNGAVVEDRSLRPAGIRVGNELRVLVSIVHRSDPYPLEYLCESDRDYFLSLLVSRWNVNSAKVLEARVLADNIHLCGLSQLEKVHVLSDAVQTLTSAQRENGFLRGLFTAFEEGFFVIPAVCPELARAVAKKAYGKLPKRQACAEAVSVSAICSMLENSGDKLAIAGKPNCDQLVPFKPSVLSRRDIPLLYSLPKMRARADDRVTVSARALVEKLVSLLQASNPSLRAVAERTLAKQGISVKDFLLENT